VCSIEENDGKNMEAQKIMMSVLFMLQSTHATEFSCPT
jgi:hypothetical protein